MSYDKEVASPKQTALGKDFSNPLMAEFKNHLSDNEESLGEDASKQGRIDDADAENGINKGALWDYWKMGGDKIKVSDDESSDLEEYWSDKEEESVEIFKIETDIFDYETPLYALSYEEQNVIIRPWLDNGIWKEPKLVKHDCKPFNYKTGCSEWPTCSWREDGYCNGGNLPEAYHIGNSLHYQDLEWYEALEDSELKDKALRNKAIMEGPRERNIDEYWWRIYKSGDLEVLES
ncbi:hypothetical protein Tco_0520911 [Tanacetum coccineum]